MNHMAQILEKIYVASFGRNAEIPSFENGFMPKISVARRQVRRIQMVTAFLILQMKMMITMV